MFMTNLKFHRFNQRHFLRLASMITKLCESFVIFDLPKHISLPKNGQPFLFIANHRSFFDLAAVLSLATKTGIPARTMVHSYYFKNHVTRTFLNALGAISISREIRQEAETEAVQTLRDGDNVAIMPEGKMVDETIWRQRDVRQFRLGFSRIACGAATSSSSGRSTSTGTGTSSSVSVIPVAIVGTEKFWPGRNYLPNLDMIMMAMTCPQRRSIITIRIGQPFNLPTTENHDENANYAEKVMRHLVRVTTDEVERKNKGPTPSSSSSSSSSSSMSLPSP